MSEGVDSKLNLTKRDAEKEVLESGVVVQGSVEISIVTRTGAKYCRLCAKEAQPGCISIFHKNEDAPPLNEQAMMCAHIQISEGDGLPVLVCRPCRVHLQSSFLFRLQCEEAQRSLQALVSLHRDFKVEVQSDCDSFGEDVGGLEEEAEKEEDLQDTALRPDVWEWDVKIENGDVGRNGISKKEDEQSIVEEWKQEGCRKCNRRGSATTETALNTYSLKSGTCNCVSRSGKQRARVRNGTEGRRAGNGDTNRWNLLLEKGNRDKARVEELLKEEETDDVRLFDIIADEQKQNMSVVAPEAVTEVPQTRATFEEVTQRGHSKRKKGVYTCKNCSSKFKLRNELRNHSALCRKKGRLPSNGRSEMSVQVLEDLSAVKEELERPHEAARHTSDKEGHKCKYCGKIYKSKMLLRKHKKELCKNSALFPARNFMCEQCGKTFKQRSVLVQHTRTHSSLKTFSCGQCGKMFTRGAHVLVHMRIHNNVKPYVCETCGRPFTKSSDLVRHKRVHSEARDYPCPLCPRAFKRSGDVTSHMRSHTGDRPYKCEPCSKSYTNHSSLQKHKRTNCSLKKGAGAQAAKPLLLPAPS